MSTQIKQYGDKPLTCIIWLHGLGADSQDMMMLVDALNINHLPIRHVFMNSPSRRVTINNQMRMPAWYDILAFNLTANEDSQGILQSELMLLKEIKAQSGQGIEHVFLAGFSQGGALSLFTGLRYKTPLAGIIALSSYVPLRNTLSDNINQSYDTPIFMAAGIHDPLVKYEWAHASYNYLKRSGFTNLSWHTYPMEHAVCHDEMNDIANWLKEQMRLKER
jgi:phospholipase/carboxylesterase